MIQKKFFSIEETYDISFIEIKDNEKKDISLILNSFLDIDENIYTEKPNDIYSQQSVYLLHFPYGKEAGFSYGIIKKIGENNCSIEHLCEYQFGSSGDLIISKLLINQNLKINISPQKKIPKLASNYKTVTNTILTHYIFNNNQNQFIIQNNNNNENNDKNCDSDSKMMIKILNLIYISKNDDNISKKKQIVE